MIILKLKYIATKDDDCKFLKDILKDRLYISTVLLKKLKLANALFVNGNSTFTTHIVEENDTILVDLDLIEESSKFADKYVLIDKPLDILYEDEYLLIVNKPSNMPVHPCADNYENTLSNIVASYLKKQNIYNIHIITRLDKDTTGICIFAKSITKC